MYFHGQWKSVLDGSCASDCSLTRSPRSGRTSPAPRASGSGWTSSGRRISGSRTTCPSGLSQSGGPPLPGPSHSGSPSESGSLRPRADTFPHIKIKKTHPYSMCDTMALFTQDTYRDSTNFSFFYLTSFISTQRLILLHRLALIIVSACLEAILTDAHIGFRFHNLREWEEV